jgi:tRNA pseudouridine32 synthase/23S rRNA pseudouridine746 synthase/23S rRNA pseudouridine1911/1915/1917 synthase
VIDPTAGLQLLATSDDIVVLNKPAGLSVLKDRTGEPCVLDLLKASLPAKPYIVHRLDKPTSGVMLIAKNQAAQSRLTRLFARRAVHKFYVARVVGTPPKGRSFIIDLPLKKGRKNRYRVAGQRDAIEQHENVWRLGSGYITQGHPSLTVFRALQSDGCTTTLALKPVTGRTHQLRVHLAWIGYPIVGDQIYGNPKDRAQTARRLHLHAHKLMVPDVGTFTAPVEK